MSVDIYLHSIWQPYYQAANANVEQRLDLLREACGGDPTPAVTKLYEQDELSGGYFRNAYSSGDVMWAMGLSWSDDVGSKLDAEDRLSIDHARELVAMIEARPLTRQRIARHFLENLTDGVQKHPIAGPIVSRFAEVTGHEPAPLLPPEFESLSQFLVDRRERLLAILRKSIALSEPLEISL
jgi:hypothetical protein